MSVTDTIKNILEYNINVAIVPIIWNEQDSYIRNQLRSLHLSEGDDEVTTITKALSVLSKIYGVNMLPHVFVNYYYEEDHDLYVKEYLGDAIVLRIKDQLAIDIPIPHEFEERVKFLNNIFEHHIKITEFISLVEEDIDNQLENYKKKLTSNPNLAITDYGNIIHLLIAEVFYNAIAQIQIYFRKFSY